MGCLQARDEKQHQIPDIVSMSNIDYVYQQQKSVQNKEKKHDQQNLKPEVSTKNTRIEPSISLDEISDDQMDLALMDEQIIQRRKQSKIKCHKKIKKSESLKGEQNQNQKQKLEDFRKFSSQKSILSQDQLISQNKLYYQNYQLTNKFFLMNMKTKSEQKIEQSGKEQVITQVRHEFDQQEEYNEIEQSRESSISCCSILQEIDQVCYSCQKKNFNTIYHLNCLHQFHKNCLLELIIQQINQKKPQILCLCQQIIKTKLIRDILEDIEIDDNEEQNKQYLVQYFQNQYEFLTTQY